MATAWNERTFPMTKTTSFKNYDRVTIDGKSGHIDYIYTDGKYANVRLDKPTVDGRSMLYVSLTDIAAEVVATKPAATTTPAAIPSHSVEAFNRAAAKALVKVARSKKTFTTDDIWAGMAKSTPEGFLLDPRTLGGFMLEAARGGTIKATSGYKPSKRPECHKRPVRVWKSLVYAGK
jgi:hypothetical protein